MTISSTSRPISEIEVRPWTSSDQPAVLELLRLVMAGGPTGERTAEYFAWKHRDNPFGRSPGMVACSGDQIIGVRLFLRWELETRGQRLRCLRAVDTATHPDYLRRGIFKSLTLGLLDHLREHDPVDLVFNTPNAASRPGYLRMGWSEVDTLPVHIAPVRPLRFVRGVMGARKANAASGAEAMTRFGATPVLPQSDLPPAAMLHEQWEAVEGLLAKRRTEPRLHTPLDLTYLRWRYVDVPGLDYRLVPVRDDAGSLTGLGVGRLRARAGLAEFTLSEVIVAGGDQRTAGRVLRAARRSGADHVAVHAATGSEAAAVLGRSGYVKVPGNGIRLVARPENGDVGPLDPMSWGLALGDLEVF